VVDSIKELIQIEIDHPAATVDPILLRALSISRSLL